MPRLPGDDRPRVNLELDGEVIEAREGENLAAALLAAGETTFARSTKYHRPRGPFCLSGACGGCLMRVDGVPNVHACLSTVRPAMRVERQNSFPSTTFDVLAATDWFFPRGLDHHALFAGVPVAQDVMSRVARKLSGLGLLPSQAAPERPPAQALSTTVAIVGAGPAGLAAAQALARRGVDFVALTHDAYPGGWLAKGPEVHDVADLVRGIPSAALRLSTLVFGLFQDPGGWQLAALEHPASLLLVRAQRFLLAVGSNPVLTPFENNDLPGVFAAQAASELIRRHRVLPGQRAVLLGAGSTADLLEQLMVRAGAEVVAVVDPAPGRGRHLQGTALRAHGQRRVKALTIQLPNGDRRRLDCDTIVLCEPGAPAIALARQGGAHSRFDERSQLFVVDASPDGKTAQPHLFVAGELRGPMTTDEARASGTRAANAIIAELEARP